MFTVCRRGPASIIKLQKAASTSLLPTAWSSIVSLSAHNVVRVAVTSRSLSVSSPALAPGRTGFARGPRRYEGSDEHNDEHIERSTRSVGGPIFKTFQELADNGLVHPNIIKEITLGMGHTTMTPVQAQTVNEALKGRDTIAQARTGTGKTLGFLIPVIQKILNDSPELATRPQRFDRFEKAKASDIRGIIMSPTRELAEQIAVEATKLVRHTGIIVQVAVGGNSKVAMLRAMQRNGCHLLVATPGRLFDLLSDSRSGVVAPDLSSFVLDEADRLLDAGFSADIEEIMTLLPERSEKDRQTLMFSATVPRGVMGLVRSTLKPDFQFVQTIQPGEQATHEKVPQKVVMGEGMENILPSLLELCKREIAQSAANSQESMPFKAIVYCSATANVELFSEAFRRLSDSPSGMYGKHPLAPTLVLEMHGQLSQSQRTHVSERFRRASSAILFSTDVTARGMDFPNVTHVIQLGLPPNRDQYIHRIGRTGRGDKPGQGWLLVTPVEFESARSLLRGLPIVQDKSLEAAAVDMTRDAQLPAQLAETLSQVGHAFKKVTRQVKDNAYHATMSTLKGTASPRQLYAMVDQYTKFGWGDDEPPASDSGGRRSQGFGGFGAGRGGDRNSFGGRRSSGSFRDHDSLGENSARDLFGSRPPPRDGVGYRRSQGDFGSGGRSRDAGRY